MSDTDATLETKTQRLVDETLHLARAFRPLWDSWRAGGVPLSYVSQAMEGHVKAYVEIAGDLWPSIEGKEERPQVIRAAILHGLDLAGVNLPGPDGLYVDAVIMASTWAWRAARAKRSVPAQT